MKRSYSKKCYVFSGLVQVSPASSPPAGQSQHVPDEAASINRDLVANTLVKELEALRNCEESSIMTGPVNIEGLSEFSLREIWTAQERHSPHLTFILCKLVEDERRENHASARLKAAITESVILKQRETRASGIQLLTSFMLVSKRTSREVITHLNRMGICMSYSQTWRRLEDVAADPERLRDVRSKPVLWVYDNLNIYRSLHHERTSDY